MHMCEIVIIRIYFYTPVVIVFLGAPVQVARLTIFVVYASNTAASASFWGCEQNIFIFSTIFRKKNVTFPIPAM